ncbi:VaFE repeat-containing surface-anchored protein [Arcanobacterium hippocoleae]
MQKLTDHVCYTNLEIGSQYELHGSLMTLPAGKPLFDINEKPIVSKKTFIPREANGCEDMEFEVDTALYAGTRTVAFEKLLQNGTEITAHEDLTDKNQTVEFAPKPKTPPAPKPNPPSTPPPPNPPSELPKTGAESLEFLIIFAIAAIGGGGALIWIRRNRKE